MIVIYVVLSFSFFLNIRLAILLKNQKEISETFERVGNLWQRNCELYKNLLLEHFPELKAEINRLERINLN